MKQAWSGIPSGRRNFGKRRHQGQLHLTDEGRPSDGWTSADSSPALKGGVTANVALRAGRGFATASFGEIGWAKGFESLIWECFCIFYEAGE